jgi:phosphoribosylanthranilate isomerase
MKLKICGMKYPENILEVATLAPDYMGFIFYEKSSRFFKGVIPQLPEHIKKVGVFVNASEVEILGAVDTHLLDAIQLHGEESVAFCQALQSLLTKTYPSKKTEIIKVFSVGDDFNFEMIKPYETVCDFFLFDTKGKLPGGNGFTFNWNLLENYPSTKPYFLSGGIGLEHTDALKLFRNNSISKYCYAIDVNSQFEIEPGLKNKEKLQQLKNTL